MYSYPDRIRAVELHIKLGQRVSFRWKSTRHLLTDRKGLPLAFVLTGRTCTTACPWRNCSMP
jgi:hypothetical protein